MKRVVTALFNNAGDAIKAVQEISPFLGPDQVSVVTKLKSDNEEVLGGPKGILLYTSHIYGQSEPLAPLQGLYPVEIVELEKHGTFAAVGPLADAIMQPEKSIADALSYLGVHTEEANYLATEVLEGNTLVAIESDNSKINEIGNLLANYGGYAVKKWDRDLDHALYPYG